MSQRIITIVLSLFTSLGSITAQPADQITIGSKHVIQSEILSEEREYWVSLPYSYDRKDLSYKKSLELNAGNANARGMLEQLSKE